tara:strand:- start:331 stop:441 length:111 start_codon:yes stop_codon:yes gene_type:complete
MSNFDPKNPDDWKGLALVLVVFGIIFLLQLNSTENL